MEFGANRLERILQGVVGVKRGLYESTGTGPTGRQSCTGVGGKGGDLFTELGEIESRGGSKEIFTCSRLTGGLATLRWFSL